MSTIGKDGVRQIYPTAAGGSEVYIDLSLSDPRKDAHFDFDSMNSSAPVTKQTEGSLTFFNTPGNVVTYASGSPSGRTIRLDLYPGAGKGQKQKYSYANNPGYLYDTQGIACHEFTGYIRGHGDLGSKIHHSLAMKVNGGDDDTIRSLVETNYPTITDNKGVYANWNYTHLAYESVPNVKQLINVPVFTENVWVGIKSVHKISADKSSSTFEYYVDLDPFDATGKPNNNWQLAATWEDTGSPTYHIKCTWKCQADKIRVDGWQNVDFTLMSDREIDFSNIPPPLVCPPGQHLDPTTNTCVPDVTPPPPPVCPPGTHLDPVTNICVPDNVPPMTRTQTRQTQTPGDPVPDSFWTITADTGPIPGPSPIPGILPIANVTAIGSDASYPQQNAIDGNLSTGWRHNGVPAWIQVDLGQICNITEVDIAWFHGDKRINTFAIDFSTDAKSFRNVFTGQSSGNTAQFDPTTIANLPAKLIKITVNGNNDPNPSNQQYAHIQEIQIKGEPAAPNPTPTGVQAIVTAPSQTAAPGATVILDGSNSKGDITAYQWTQTSGTAVTLMNATTKTTMFTAPGVTGPLGFALRVTDKSGQTSTANAIVQIATSPPPTCPPGQHFDPTTGTCVPDASNVDQFGIQKLYGDKAGGPVTYINMNSPSQTTGASPGNNPEGNSSFYPNFVKNSDGSWKNTNGTEVRWAWTSSNLNGGNYPGDSNICKCYDTDNKNHYMSGPGDWPPAVEMTGYFRSPPGSTTSSTHNGETHFEFVINGHRSTTSSTSSGPGGCQLGCAGSYHCNMYPLTGRKKFEKDYHHSFAYAQDINGVNNNSATPKWADDNLWHGFKAVFYILPDGTTVQLEHWSDFNNTNTWVKDHSFQDDGIKWTPKASYTGCGNGPQTIQFLFGGPLIDFRADNWNNYDLKNLSVRAIDPTQKLMGREHDKLPGHSGDLVVDTDELYQRRLDWDNISISGIPPVNQLNWDGQTISGVSSNDNQLHTYVLEEPPADEEDDILKKAKIDAEIIAKEAEDPKVRRAAKTTAKKAS